MRCRKPCVSPRPTSATYKETHFMVVNDSCSRSVMEFARIKQKNVTHMSQSQRATRASSYLHQSSHLQTSYPSSPCTLAVSGWLAGNPTGTQRSMATTLAFLQIPTIPSKSSSPSQCLIPSVDSSKIHVSNHPINALHLHLHHLKSVSLPLSAVTLPFFLNPQACLPLNSIE